MIRSSLFMHSVRRRQLESENFRKSRAHAHRTFLHAKVPRRGTDRVSRSDLVLFVFNDQIIAIYGLCAPTAAGIGEFPKITRACIQDIRTRKNSKTSYRSRVA